MSQQYPDLSLTNFPSSLDTFTTWLNIVASDGQLIQQYQAAMQAGNTTLANQILAQIPQGTQKIITATDLNTMSQAILAIERFYLTDIQPYVEDKQADWLTVINQFSYQGVWSSNTSYVTNNFVSYSVSGLTLIYLAISDPPLGTPPTNQIYWRLLTIQGQQGASGVGLSYRQQWSASQAYSTNDAVTYDGGLYMALQNSTNQNPATATSYWKLVMALEATVYPIQDTQPTTQDVGGLWFNTQSNPTQYYYLETLTNPATASEIVYGQEAYDEMGNLIVGTLPVPISIAVTTNPTQMSYIVGQSFNPAGMVVTATYSDGSQSTVSGYTYSPTGALTAQDTTITIQYIENGVTVDTTLAITVIAVNTTLNNNSWDIISHVSSQSLGDSYWAVGDRKAVTVNGTVGTQAINGTYYVYILGFDHNSSREGTGITFGTFKTALSGGTDICLVDSHYNDYSTTGGQKWFNMNHSSNTNSGGWKGCDLRYDVLGSTNSNNNDAGTTTATSPVSGTLMAALPSDLRAVMKPMTIYTDNTGGGSNTASYVTASVDYLPLLAEFEIFGTRSYANSAEQNYQQQYQYYKNGNSKVKYRHSSTSSTAYWWERSPYYYNSSTFCFVNTNGNAGNSSARFSYGLAPAFRV